MSKLDIICASQIELPIPFAVNVDPEIFKVM